MNTDPLLEDFAASQPREMSALLADADPQEVCGLLRQLPAATAARLAANLPSRQLSRALKQLAASEVGELLCSAGHEDAISLVSLLSESRYVDILDACPASRRKQLRRLFELPSQSLGAFASPNYIRVQVDLGCAAFMQQLQSHEEEFQLPIYAVNSDGKYVGEVNPIAVIARKNQKSLIGDIVREVEPLSGQLSITAALKSRQWTRHRFLPVVDGKDRLLGSVQRHTLIKHAPRTRTESYGFERAITDVALSYFEFFERMLKLLFTGKLS